MTTELTPASLALFLSLARDAGNWSGMPLVTVTREQKGNLTDLKTKKLLTTVEDEGCSFACFTAQGVELAAEHGVTVHEV